MDFVLDILLLIGKLALFVLLSIIFVPAFFIVTYLQDTWSKLLAELFKV